MRRFRILQLVCGFLLSASFPLLAGNITAGKPTADGTDVISIYKNGGGFGIPIEVPNILAADMPDEKAVKIMNAINAVKPGVASIDPNNSANVLLNGYKAIGLGAENNSKEPIKVGDAGQPGNMDLAIVGYSGTPTGLDINGDESVFTASFGYDGLTVSDTIDYDNLTGTSIDDVLTDFYDSFLSQLPTQLDSALSLDLPDDQILFQFPNNETNYFVNIATTDAGVEEAGGIADDTPEPGTILLAAGAVAALAVRTRLRTGSIPRS